MTGADPIVALLRLNSRLFLNCLDGVTDEEAAQRPDANTNSLGFIACHVLDARHFLAASIGLTETNAFAELLGGVRSIDELASLPPLREIRREWTRLAPTLEACVADLRAEDLNAPSPQRFPIDQPTMLGMIAFLVQHESYHIGQMALLRKFVGHAAMKYA